MSDKIIRCSWCGDDPLYQKYHDEEWGKPVYDDKVLFEFLTLEGAQAGLSWITVLRKRESYRELFFNWDIEKIARLTDKELEDILKNPSIIRNRLKIFSVRKNALVVRKIQEECGSFSKYLWKYVNNTPEIHYGEKIYDFPTSNTISDNISKDLKKLGMSFVGTTIIYAFIQAVGMVNDHINNCSFKGE